MISFKKLPQGAPEDSEQTTVIENGLLSGVETGAFHPDSGRVIFWHRGAAYDSKGRLIEHSRRAGGIHGDYLHSLDQPMWLPSTTIRELRGSYYYAGPWMQHFGHFLLETIPTLWAHDGRSEVVFHKMGNPDSYKLELLRLVGVESQPIFISDPIRVERMIVPSRPVFLNAWCSNSAARTWGRIRDAVVAGQRLPSKRVWLSRTRAEMQSENVNRELGFKEFDDVFAGLGFEVIYPEELPIKEQIRCVASAEVIAAFEGSALHLSAFAHPGTRVLALGSPSRPNGNRAQPTIDASVGNLSAVIPFSESQELTQKVKSIFHAGGLPTADGRAS